MNLSDRIKSQNPHWASRPLTTYPTSRQLLDQILTDIHIQPISLITGMRRSGKSILIKQLAEKLIANLQITPTQILFFEFSPTDSLDTMDELITYFLRSVSDPTIPKFIFLDEVQYVTNFEVKLKEWYDQIDRIKIIATGSYSLLYKKQLKESLAGRYLHYPLFPLNFVEYLNISHSTSLALWQSLQTTNIYAKEDVVKQLNPIYRQFLTYYRLPELISLNQDQIKRYVEELKLQLINQDALIYFGLEKPQILIALFNYFCAHGGGEISYDRLSKELGINRETVSKYVTVLESMGLIYSIYNSTNPIKKLNSRKKIYVNSLFTPLDPGDDQQMGIAVESYILEQLLSRRQTVSYYRERNQEIDFVLFEQQQAYEVKFRTQIKDVEKFLALCTRHRWQLSLITLDQIKSDSPPFTPAIIF